MLTLPYEPPALVVLGSLHQRTQTSVSGGMDITGYALSYHQIHSSASGPPHGPGHPGSHCPFDFWAFLAFIHFDLWGFLVRLFRWFHW